MLIRVPSLGWPVEPYARDRGCNAPRTKLTAVTWQSKSCNRIDLRAMPLGVSSGGSPVVDSDRDHVLAEHVLHLLEVAPVRGRSKDGVITKVPIKEHVPPDVTACIF